MNMQLAYVRYYGIIHGFKCYTLQDENNELFQSTLLLQVWIILELTEHSFYSKRESSVCHDNR